MAPRKGTWSTIKPVVTVKKSAATKKKASAAKRKSPSASAAKAKRSPMNLGKSIVAKELREMISKGEI